MELINSPVDFLTISLHPSLGLGMIQHRSPGKKSASKSYFPTSEIIITAKRSYISFALNLFSKIEASIEIEVKF